MGVLAELAAELLGPDIGHFDLRCREALRREQCASQRDLQLQLLSRAPLRRRQRCEQPQPLCDVADRFLVRGAVEGAFSGLQPVVDRPLRERSEEHTSELQSLMRISYAVCCLKKKKEITK